MTDTPPQDTPADGDEPQLSPEVEGYQPRAVELSDRDDQEQRTAHRPRRDRDLVPHGATPEEMLEGHRTGYGKSGDFETRAHGEQVDHGTGWAPPAHDIGDHPNRDPEWMDRIRNDAGTISPSDDLPTPDPQLDRPAG